MSTHIRQGLALAVDRAWRAERAACASGDRTAWAAAIAGHRAAREALHAFDDATVRSAMITSIGYAR